MKYSVICADPPWSFNDGLKKMGDNVKRSAESQYDVMSFNEIFDMDVASLACPDGCVLALWVPGSMLVQGLEAMKRWGFIYKQNFVWVKTKKDALKCETDMNKMTRVGMGRLFRQSHELCLIGTSGKSVYKKLENKGQRSVSFDLNKGHSIKPELLQDRLELMFPDTNKLEIFARRVRPNWECIGNEINEMHVTDAIQELKDDND